MLPWDLLSCKPSTSYLCTPFSLEVASCLEAGTFHLICFFTLVSSLARSIAVDNLSVSLWDNPGGLISTHAAVLVVLPEVISAPSPGSFISLDVLWLFLWVVWLCWHPSLYFHICRSTSTVLCSCEYRIVTTLGRYNSVNHLFEIGRNIIPSPDRDLRLVIAVGNDSAILACQCSSG